MRKNFSYTPYGNISVKDIRSKMNEFLEAIGLERVLSTKEIETELHCTERLHESALFLGIISRCAEEKKQNLMTQLLPLIIHWKNFIPKKELIGLSPIEYEKRYPRGTSELWIMNKLFHAYEQELHSRAHLIPEIDLSEDFAKFEEQFFELIPVHQPYPEMSVTMSHRSIIMEERRRHGHPASVLNNISATLFAHDIIINPIDNIEIIEGIYEQSINDLEHMKPQKKKNVKKLSKILTNLASIEPFMKCSKSAQQYYNAFAGIAILLHEYSLAKGILQQSLAINPRYKPAKELLNFIHTHSS
jgi:hypothetical protein